MSDVYRDLAERATNQERLRQRAEEGYTPEHDARYRNGELTLAAECYAGVAKGVYPPDKPPSIWPWAPEFWKPQSRERNLIRAAALRQAELDRIDLWNRAHDRGPHESLNFALWLREAAVDDLAGFYRTAADEEHP